jgi:hypothetical protein
MPNKQEKCANSDCNCKAAADSKYCSPSCEEMGGVTVTKCPCGHAECEAAAGTGTISMGAQ